MVPSATPARSAISATREWKKPCSAITSMAASRIRWCLSDVPFIDRAVVREDRLGMRNLEFTWICRLAQPLSGGRYRPQGPEPPGPKVQWILTITALCHCWHTIPGKLETPFHGGCAFAFPRERVRQTCGRLQGSKTADHNQSPPSRAGQ